MVETGERLQHPIGVVGPSLLFLMMTVTLLATVAIGSNLALLTDLGLLKRFGPIFKTVQRITVGMMLIN